MQEILVLSGKGGTGKTSITSSLIALNKHCIACDYDVDASNLPLLLKPKVMKATEFSSSQTAFIDMKQCTACGLCEEYCRFEAIKGQKIDPTACEGCALCYNICPVQAVTMKARRSGRWFKGQSVKGPLLYYAELRPGEENSGKLVAEVKNAARQYAKEENAALIIADGPPGIGCAVISALVGVSLTILVAEPSISGFSDLKRLYDLLCSRNAAAVLIINKWDLDPDLSQTMQEWAASKNIPYAGQIPFSRDISDAVAEGNIPAEIPELRCLFQEIWGNIFAVIEHLRISQGMSIRL